MTSAFLAAAGRTTVFQPHVQTLLLPPAYRFPSRQFSRTMLKQNSRATPEVEDGKISVLCLHGKGNNGDSFQKILTPLENYLKTTKLDFQFDYLTAPFSMNDKDDSEDTKREMQWWSLPPGVRSYNANEYKGFEESAQLVENELKNKHYDFILGHSQGAILLSALMTCDSWTARIGEKEPLGYILNGCAWPNPYTDQLESYSYSPDAKQDSAGSGCKPKALFIIGENDAINPPEGAKRVRDILKKGGLEVDTFHHGGGHSVPVQDGLDVHEIATWIYDVASSTSTASYR